MPDQNTASSTSNDGSARAARPYPDKYARRLLTERRRKDEAFRHAGWSPLRSTRKPSFDGLAYFQPDVSYRFAGLRLEPIHGDDEGPFENQTSYARPRPAYRLGRLRFDAHERELALTAYRVGSSEPDTLFVPFRDGTSGRETYPEKFRRLPLCERSSRLAEPCVSRRVRLTCGPPGRLRCLRA